MGGDALRFASRLTVRLGAKMTGRWGCQSMLAARLASSDRSLFARVTCPTIAWSFIRSMA